MGIALKGIISSIAFFLHHVPHFFCPWLKQHTLEVGIQNCQINFTEANKNPAHKTHKTACTYLLTIWRLTPHNYISSGRTSHPFAPTSLSLLFMSLLLWKLVNQPAKQWKILQGAFFLIKTTLLCEFDWWICDGIKFSWWHKSELPTS